MGFKGGIKLNKKLIDYIREESQCNYTDILDYLSEINQCGDELKAKYLGDLIWYIHCSEQEEINQEGNE